MRKLKLKLKLSDDMRCREYRIVLALLGVFIALGALVWAIHGVVSDDRMALRWSIVVIAVSLAGVVALLNPRSGR